MHCFYDQEKRQLAHNRLLTQVAGDSTEILKYFLYCSISSGGLGLYLIYFDIFNIKYII